MKLFTYILKTSYFILSIQKLSLHTNINYWIELNLNSVTFVIMTVGE